MAIYRINPYQPIPNNPFYSPESNYIKGEYGPFIVGSGFVIDNITGTISASGGGGGGSITSIGAGTGIQVTAPAGPIPVVSLNTSGVVAGVYSYPSSITIDPYGRITSVTPAASAPSTTVVSPITNIGTALAPVIGIQDANSGQKGAVQVGANICSSAGTISVCSSSTTQSGVVQLYDALDNSTGVGLALTAKQGYNLQQQINGLLVSSNLVFAATLNASTNLVETPSSDGLAATPPFTAGSPPPTAVSTIDDYFMIVTTGNPAYTPPGGGTYDVSPGDWFIANGTTGKWDFVNSGTTTPTATTTTYGTVCLATVAETQAGAPINSVVTADTAKQTYIPYTCYTTKGNILGATAAGVVQALPVGTPGQVLTASSISATGLSWSTPTAAIPCSCLTTKGGIITASIPTVPTLQLPGADGTILTACSLSGTGLCWVTPAYIPTACISGKGAMIVGTALSTPATLPVGANGQVLTVDSTCATGVKWGAAGISCIATGTGLTGGPIVSSGTIALANTTVTAGTYSNPTIVVDAQGRLTSAASGTPPVTAITGTSPISVTAGTSPVVSIASASTTAPGAVQLNDTVTSTSTTQALTAAQGKNLQDQITALSNASNLQLAGTVDASTGLVDSVTSTGVAAGYTVGGALPAASALTNDTYVIVTAPGTLTPPGGSATPATRGDWFLVVETTPGVYAWSFLNVGFDAPAATTTVAGIVCLSTNALAQAGVDATTALTPAAAASAYIPKTCVTAKGALITGTAASTPVPLAVGTDGYALVACSTAATGLCWADIAALPATPTVLGIVYGCTDTTATANVALGYQTSNLTATSSVHIGYQAGCGDNGDRNTFVGLAAGASVPTGTDNIGIGWCTYSNANAGSANVALGSSALKGSGSGNFTSGNVGVGYEALCQVCGSFNVAIGYDTGCGLTGTSACNVLIGPNVQAPVTPGCCQLVIGYSATCNWLTGCSSKAIRPGAGIVDCTGSCGTAGQVLASTGANSLCWISASGANATPTVAGVVLGCTTSGNAALGCNALGAGTAGAACGHVAIGTNALFAATGSAYNDVAIGANALCSNTSGADNTAIGFCALALNQTGYQNIAIGNYALRKATCYFNVAIGPGALWEQTTGTGNVAIGAAVMQSNINGINNVAIGIDAYRAAVGNSGSVAIGAGAACLTSQGRVVAVGEFAGQCIMSCGTALGWAAGFQGTGVYTAIGAMAGCNLTGGINNTFVGFRSGFNVTSGNCNTFVGHLSGTGITGSDNIYIGNVSGCALSTQSGNRNIFIGSGSGPSSTTVSNEVNIYNGTVWARFQGGAGSWSFTSDARLKKDIEPLALGLDFLKDVEPRSFTWKADEKHDVGFIAQEMDAVLQKHDAEYTNLVNKENPDEMGVSGTQLIPILVNAVKELAAEVAELKAKLNDK